MKKVKRPCRRLTELILLLLIPLGLTGLATTSVRANEDTENVESYYANPSQAAHAAQLADKAALSNDEVQQAYDNYQEALDALENEPSEENGIAAKEREKEFQDKLTDITGELDSDIEAMRASGMGWGNIAHELGVHPSALGLGHAKNQKSFSQQEIAEATARNTKSGFATGHGAGVQSDIGNSKQGKSRGNSSNAGGNKGEKSGKAGGKGDKGNNGNSGGNGGGNSGGNSGGNGGGKK